jgi:hypothetical protein
VVGGGHIQLRGLPISSRPPLPASTEKRGETKSGSAVHKDYGWKFVNFDDVDTLLSFDVSGVDHAYAD